MINEDTKILEFNQYRKSKQTPSIIYANLESLIKEVDGLKIILENRPQQNYVKILSGGIQGFQYGHLMVQKMIMIEER